MTWHLHCITPYILAVYWGLNSKGSQCPGIYAVLPTALWSRVASFSTALSLPQSLLTRYPLRLGGPCDSHCFSLPPATWELRNCVTGTVPLSHLPRGSWGTGTTNHSGRNTGTVSLLPPARRSLETGTVCNSGRNMGLSHSRYAGSECRNWHCVTFDWTLALSHCTNLACISLRNYHFVTPDSDIHITNSPRLHSGYWWRVATFRGPPYTRIFLPPMVAAQAYWSIKYRSPNTLISLPPMVAAQA